MEDAGRVSTDSYINSSYRDFRISIGSGASSGFSDTPVDKKETEDTVDHAMRVENLGGRSVAAFTGFCSALYVLPAPTVLCSFRFRVLGFRV